MPRARMSNPSGRRLLLLVGAIAAMVMVCACATSKQRPLSHAAPIGAYLTTGARPTAPSQIDPRIERWGVIGAVEELAGRPITVLELSGGGQYGAFGAGFLNGWTERGTRPRFDLVTGISTGALLATHAFLGTPADDAVLKVLYTGIDRRDIYRGNVFGGLLGGPALNRTDPMAELIEKTITPEVLERVAAEWDNHRRLFVAATNLDYKQVWVFSLSEIAKHGGPDALALYRKVLHAAASPPVVFPPVEIDGHLFGDAAVRENLLVMGLLKGGEPRRAGPGQQGQVYVVVNGKDSMPPGAVTQALSPIATDTLNALLTGRMHTTLILAYAGARLHGYGFNMVALPDDVPITGNPLAFDRVEMRRVFAAGQRLGRGDDPWLHQPPASDELGPWAIELFDQLERLTR